MSIIIILFSAFCDGQQQPLEPIGAEWTRTVPYVAGPILRRALNGARTGVNRYYIYSYSRNGWKTSLYSLSLSDWPIISFFFFSFGVAVVALLPTWRLWLLSRARV